MGVGAHVMTTETGRNNLTCHSNSPYILIKLCNKPGNANKTIRDIYSTLQTCNYVHLIISVCFSVSEPKNVALCITSVCTSASTSPRSPCSRTCWRSCLGSSSSASSGLTGISPGSPASSCAPSDTS